MQIGPHILARHEVAGDWLEALPREERRRCDAWHIA